MIEHDQRTMLAQRVLGIACGWEDLIDHHGLRVDPLMQAASERDVDEARPLASPATLCRLENRVDRGACVELSKLLVEQFIESFDAPPDELVLDERGAAFCWAWERFTLGTAITGVLYNELRTDGSFRRTPVRRDVLELERVRQKLGAEARDMTGAGIAVYPSPSWTVCSGCAYRPPCIALDTGVTADEVMTTSYRQRAPEEEQVGRLGGVTWSTGRGAAPPQFGRGSHPGP